MNTTTIQIDTDLKRKLLQEEAQDQLYSLVSLKALTSIIYRSLASTILPIVEKDYQERLSVYNNLERWMQVQRRHRVIVDENIRKDREQLLEAFGLSKTIYYASITKYRTNYDYIMHCEQCLLSLRGLTEESDVQRVTKESYEQYLKLQENYPREFAKEIEIIKEKADSELQAELFKSIRIQDYLYLKTGLKYEDIEKYKNFDMEPLSLVKKTTSEIITLSDKDLPEIRTAKSNPLEKKSPFQNPEFIKEAANEEEQMGYFKIETCITILKITLEDTGKELVELICNARQERRKLFDDLDKYLDKYEYYEKEIGKLLDNRRRALLKIWELSAGTWEKSMEKHEKDPEFQSKNEEASLTNLIQRNSGVKNITIGDYKVFLETQIEYLKANKKEFKKLKKELRPEFFAVVAKTRVADFVGMKCHIEVEDIMKFLQEQKEIEKNDGQWDEITTLLESIKEIWADLAKKKEKTKRGGFCAVF